MSDSGSIREFGVIGVGIGNDGLDKLSVDKTTYTKLLELATDVIKPNYLKPIIKGGKQLLQVQNYVGMIRLPNGFELEILPKITNDPSEIDLHRAVLWKLLVSTKATKVYEHSITSLMSKKTPWSESLIKLFTAMVMDLVKHGVERQYLSTEDRKRFLKGRLILTKQLRRGPGNPYFDISYQALSFDRPENRLIKLALQILLRWSKVSWNIKMLRELLHLFEGVPASTDIRVDLLKWSTDRKMANYWDLRPWITLILEGMSPFSLKGKAKGISLLFPMERLFQEYVAQKLSGNLCEGHKLRLEKASQWLVQEHRERSYFQLRPDISVMENSSIVAVLDTKWKLLDQYKTRRAEKYQISEADFYQLFAYGKKYLDGAGQLMLIYPKHSRFDVPLRSFNFDSNMQLWVVPFCLETDELVTGEWCANNSWYVSNKTIRLHSDLARETHTVEHSL